MKRFLLLVLVGVLALTACAPKAQEPVAAVLKVSDGTIEKTYTVDDLKALGETQATFQDVIYVGIPLTVLLQDAGIDTTALTAVKAALRNMMAGNHFPRKNVPLLAHGEIKKLPFLRKLTYFSLLLGDVLRTHC